MSIIGGTLRLPRDGVLSPGIKIKTNSRFNAEVASLDSRESNFGDELASV